MCCWTDMHALNPYNNFKKTYTSKPWITTGIAKSLNLYKKFTSETNLQKKEECQIQFRTYRNYISTLFRCSKDSYYNGPFEENKENIKSLKNS